MQTAFRDIKHNIEVLEVQAELFRAFATHGAENGFTEDSMQAFTEWRQMRDTCEITIYVKHTKFGNQRFDLEVRHPSDENYSRARIVGYFIDDMIAMGSCKDHDEYMKEFYGIKPPTNS